MGRVDSGWVSLLLDGAFFLGSSRVKKKNVMYRGLGRSGTVCTLGCICIVIVWGIVFLLFWAGSEGKWAAAISKDKGPKIGLFNGFRGFG